MGDGKAKGAGDSRRTAQFVPAAAAVVILFFIENAGFLDRLLRDRRIGINTEDPLLNPPPPEA